MLVNDTAAARPAASPTQALPKGGASGTAVGIALAFFVVYAAAWLAIPPDTAPPSTMWWAEQVAYLTPFLFACIAGGVAAMRLTGFSKRFWTLMTVLNVLILSVELEYTRTTAVGNAWDAGSWTDFVLVAMPVTVFALIVVSASRSFSWSPVVRARIGVSGLILFVIVFVACYRWGVAPYFANHGVTDIQTVLQVSFRMAVGVGVLGFVLVNLVSVRANGWHFAEVLVSAGVGLYALGLVGSPHQALSELASPQAGEQLVELAWFAGQFLVGLGAVVAVTGSRPLALVRGGRASRPPSVLAVPLAFHSVAVVALLSFAHTAALTTLTADEQLVYWLAAASIGVLLVVRDLLVAVERGLLFRASVTDLETGLGNRRHFTEQVEERLASATRTGERALVAVIGIDGLERLDGMGGTASAEQMLGQAASAIRRALGRSTVIARLSWDSFGVLLRDADAPAVLAIEATRSIAARASGAAASAGVAFFPEHGLTADEMRRAAEGALYWARYHSGPPTVVFNPDRIRTHSEDVGIGSLSQRSHLATLRALADAVDSRDAATEGHSRRVADLAVQLAERVGLPAAEVRVIEIAALVHDVGKVSLPESILRAKRALNEAERDLLEEHPALGERIVSSAGMALIEPGVRSHHERWDGNGYPDRLARTDIPLEARIIAISDAYEVMLSGSTLRPGLSSGAALQEIDHGIGSLFDPELAEQFIVMIAGQSITAEP